MKVKIFVILEDEAVTIPEQPDQATVYKHQRMRQTNDSCNDHCDEEVIGGKVTQVEGKTVSNFFVSGFVSMRYW
jgi:hypothetical protein|tara:strand:+ start:204 stop:425 length:222 start_codon:yes stop_codon:yes gene_type:complete